MNRSKLGTTALRTNLAEAPVTKAIRDGRVNFDIVMRNCCGPELAQNGFKPMLREHAFHCGELAIVTYLQANWPRPCRV